MKNANISGERLFLLYAAPCAEVRHHRGLISDDDLDEITRLVDSDEEPSQEFLDHCFPNAVSSFLETHKDAVVMGKPWPLEPVAAHWHNHKGLRPDCAVEIATVVLVKAITLIVDVAGPLDTVTRRQIFNRYEHILRAGDRIFIHRIVAIEKIF